jgi:hypothetical protein
MGKKPNQKSKERSTYNNLTTQKKKASKETLKELNKEEMKLIYFFLLGKSRSILYTLYNTQSKVFK